MSNIFLVKTEEKIITIALDEFLKSIPGSVHFIIFSLVTTQYINIIAKPEDFMNSE